MTDSDSRPTLDASVLIATRDRGDELEVTLRAMARLRTEQIGWELLVIDNGSTDNTQEVLKSAPPELPLRTLIQPFPGKNAALNLAIGSAEGRLLVFTDDDITPDPGWIRALCSAAARWPDDSIFGGPILPEFPANTPDWIADPKFSYASVAYARYVPECDEGPVEKPPFGGNLALRAETLSRFAFDPTIGPAGKDYAQGSEYQLTRRMNDAGLRNIFVPDAMVKHRIHPDHVRVEWLVKRAFRFGRGTERIHPTQARRVIRSLPLSLWWKLGVSSFRCWVAQRRSQRERLELELESSFLAGRAHECRQRSASK